MKQSISRIAKSLLAVPFAFAIAGLAFGPALAEMPPTCHGTNLAGKLARENSVAFARIAAKAAATPNANAVLWKIGKDGVEPSYLLGTINVTDERVTKLPAVTQAILDQAKSVAVTIRTTVPGEARAVLQEFANLLLVTPETRYGDLLTDSENQQLIESVMKAGATADTAMNLQPWAAARLLTKPECETARERAGIKVLEANIEASAMAKGTPVVWLETKEDVFRSPAEAGRDAQIAELKVALKFRDRTEDLNETLIGLYLERRIAEINPLREEMIGDPALSRLALDNFENRLIREQNTRMRDRMQPLLTKGGAFIAAGALNLIGRDGLVELLRTAGYKLTPVN